MKTLKILICLVCFMFLCGCGHNAVVHSKGWGIDISWTGDSFIPNLRIGYWDVSSAIVRENAYIEIKSNAGLNANTGKGNNTDKVANALGVDAGGNASSEIKMKTGMQINGYTKSVLTNQSKTKQDVDMAKQLFNNKNDKNENK